MNQSHRGNRTHIVIAGRCNTGKSTLLNRLVGQQASMVSAQPGTTADPVKVAFELLPHGPVLLYDTAGLDEAHTLGSLRLMALTRVLIPRAHMPVTSALGLQGDAVRLKALEIADVLMPSLTPQTVRGDYAIYPGKNASDQMPLERARAMQNMLRSHGFCLPAGPGGAWRLEHKETL